ncbi:MAG: glycosyltransferase family 4 protein [Verrucomicrobiota bacterium JB023]|nr:glycosyltransferase family 4 protein [Verrucomicrobiota bacterium JB023]
MKVAFYLNNSKIAGVDLSEPAAGNPGCGGTQYLFAALPYFLKLNEPSIEPLLIASSVDRLPPSLETRQAGDLASAAAAAVDWGADFFVFRDDISIVSDALKDSGTKGILWSHNLILDRPELDAIADNGEVARVVMVGQEAADFIRDHRISEKLSVIHNGFPHESVSAWNKDEQAEEKNDVNRVVYVGSLVPAKGFHRLARIWPRVEELVPDAHLDVIGSGQLYNSGEKMGRFGLSMPDYEEEFMRPLTLPNGEIRSSVTFHGKMGSERFDLMSAAKVGVVNPTGETEVCPGSAIEFQAVGVPVVSAKEWGLLDTVKNKVSGLLCETDEEMAQGIALLLNDEAKRLELSRNCRSYVRQAFNFEKVCREWAQLFEAMAGNRKLSPVPVKGNWRYRGKWMREMIRVGKQYGLIKKDAPAVMFDSPKRWAINYCKSLVRKQG